MYFPSPLGSTFKLKMAKMFVYREYVITSRKTNMISQKSATTSKKLLYSTLLEQIINHLFTTILVNPFMRPNKKRQLIYSNSRHYQQVNCLHRN